MNNNHQNMQWTKWIGRGSGITHTQTHTGRTVEQCVGVAFVCLKLLGSV